MNETTEEVGEEGLTDAEVAELWEHGIRNGDEYLVAAVRELRHVRASRLNLIKILELGEQAEWADIVYYTAKVKGSLRMANTTVRRRHTDLAEALQVAPDTLWPLLIDIVKSDVARLAEE